eukprot:scaffold23523_cov204-Skeletonema_marinoi.AAC.4
MGAPTFGRTRPSSSSSLTLLLLLSLIAIVIDSADAFFFFFMGTPPPPEEPSPRATTYDISLSSVCCCCCVAVVASSVVENKADGDTIGAFPRATWLFIVNECTRAAVAASGRSRFLVMIRLVGYQDAVVIRTRPMVKLREQVVCDGKQAQ